MSLVTRDVGAFAALLPPRGPLIGLDVGAKTIGLALCDVLRAQAFVAHTIWRRKFTLDAAEIAAFVQAEKVAGVVIGLPLNMDGSAGRRVQSTESFARNLLPIVGGPLLLMDERQTTLEARETLDLLPIARRDQKQHLDAFAAQLILQRALEALKIAP